MERNASRSALEPQHDVASSTRALSLQMHSPDSEQAATSGQQLMDSVSGGSLAAAPSDFVPLLDHLRSAPSTRAALMMQLQRGYGNHFVGRMIQAKLAISQPGDEYEEEADRVANVVMRAPSANGDASLSVTNQIKPESLQRLSKNGTETIEAPAVDKALSSGGHPLDSASRAFFEPRFGQDFSQVRVHADAGAAEAASAISARAFTTGKDIVFGAHEYSPQSREGQMLLAHELTHVVQQENGSAGGPIQRAPEAPKPQILPPGTLDASYFSLTGTVPQATGAVVTEPLLADFVRIRGPRIDWKETITLIKPTPTGQSMNVGFMQTLMASSREMIYQSAAASFKYKIRTPQSRDEADLTAGKPTEGARFKEGEKLRSPGGFYSDKNTTFGKERMQGRVSLSTQGEAADINMIDQPSFPAAKSQAGAPLVGTSGDESFRLSIVAVEQGKAPFPLKNYDWGFSWNQTIDVSNPLGPTGTGGGGISITPAPDGAPQLTGDPAKALGLAWYEFPDLVAAKSVSTDILMANLALAKAGGDSVAHGLTVEALKSRNPAINVQVGCLETARFFGEKDDLSVSLTGAASIVKSISLGEGDNEIVVFNLLDVYPDLGAIDSGSTLQVIINVTSDKDSQSGSIPVSYPFHQIPATKLELGNFDPGTYVVSGFLA